MEGSLGSLANLDMHIPAVEQYKGVFMVLTFEGTESQRVTNRRSCHFSCVETICLYIVLLCQSMKCSTWQVWSTVSLETGIRGTKTPHE